MLLGGLKNVNSRKGFLAISSYAMIETLSNAIDRNKFPTTLEKIMAYSLVLRVEVERDSC